MRRIVAIHGNNGFARDWPAAAETLGVGVRRVDAFGASLWEDLEGCDALLWSLNQDDPRDLEFGRSVLQAVAQRGLRVFPDHATAWHFDDKVAQKYLLEAIGAPIADTWVFFDREEATAFLRGATFPLVFKLRRGAGSLNVRLVRDLGEGLAWIGRMFGRGVRTFPVRDGIVRAVGRARQSRPSAGNLVARGRRAWTATVTKLLHPQVERGYVLFQRYVPNNTGDVRVTVIGKRAFVFMRKVRPNDFRASGSGLISYPGPADVPLDMVSEAFRVSRAIGAQSLAVDFVRDPQDGRSLLLEVSFSFVAQAVARCPGWLGPELAWHEGSSDPAELILQDILAPAGA